MCMYSDFPPRRRRRPPVMDMNLMGAREADSFTNDFGTRQYSGISATSNFS